ncbi:TylF/MycF/NovP-related O-methyltransferase [Alicyclobacillus ferrooxydans]|uniref:Methyltransferase n=1 Tax=Alicyclobacillus ferrooxydans TaxID=471514 RepID=A0A0P9CH63_9BACL|nr:TylF/MycF/NovP-related O-methyltransferase [Alicyclobacillus ferrooxydans]KPV42386.1 methyltransferase [Alicyclobacillus ferrooxydans]
MKRAVVFGAGDGGLRVSYLLSDEFEIVAFVDNDPSKQGSKFLGKQVYSPKALQVIPYDLIIIGNIHGEQVMVQLRELGISDSVVVDYYQNEIFNVRTATLKLVADEIHSRRLHGSVAELGVFRGDFAREIGRVFPQRTFYLFDTFEGFSESDIKTEMAFGYSDSRIGEFSATSEELVLHKIPDPNRCVVRKGYFPETSNGLEEEFVFVSLDVDLFAPIYAGLQYFYPRLVSGGYIFVHDYNSSRFHGTKEAVNRFRAEYSVPCVPIPDLCGSIIITKP